MKCYLMLLFALFSLGTCSRKTPTDVTPSANQAIDTLSNTPYALISFHNNVSNTGVLVLDISTPQEPVVVCSLQGHSTRVDYSGNIMCFNSHFCDVSDPAHPSILSNIDTLEAHSISLQGFWAYFGISNNNLIVVDFKDPAHPQKLGCCHLPNTVMGIAAKGNYIYVANHWHGLRVIDVNNPSNPHVVDSLLILEAVAEELFIDGHYVYLCQQSQVSIIDIFEPAKPARVARYENGGVYYSFVADNFMYYVSCGIQIVDVHDPPHPTFVCQLYLPGRPLRVAVFEDCAYVVGDNGCGLRVVDVRDKNNPLLVKTLLTDHTLYDVVIYRAGH